MPYRQVEEEKFFYSTNTPHQWSSGPTVHYFNDRHEKITSLEEAKSLALAAQEGQPGMESYVAVSWGTEIALKNVYEAK